MNLQKNRSLTMGAACVALLLVAGVGSWFLFSAPASTQVNTFEPGDDPGDLQPVVADEPRRPSRQARDRGSDEPEDSQIPRTPNRKRPDPMTEEELRKRRGPTNLPGSIPP